MRLQCKILMVLLALALASADAACPPGVMRDVETAITAADGVELLSLSPKPAGSEDDFGELRTGGLYGGFKVLGVVRLTGGDKRSLASALCDAFIDVKGSARCFNPRHGVRVTSGGHRYDLVICFECAQILPYVDGRLGKVVILGQNIGGTVKAFNGLLRKYNIPLPGEFED